MKRLLDVMKGYQAVNIEDKGIAFAEEIFTEMYEEAINAHLRHMSQVRMATGKGLIIGAVSVGVVGLGLKSLEKLKKRRVSEKQEEDIEQAREEVEAIKTEIKDIDEKLKKVRMISEEEVANLTAIIDELNKNEAKH